MDIGVGDWVECICARTCGCGCFPAGTSVLILGKIYQVETVCSHIEESPGLTLVEVSTPGDHHCFPARDFRPIYRPKQELIESLMVKQRVTA